MEIIIDQRAQFLRKAFIFLVCWAKICIFAPLNLKNGDFFQFSEDYLPDTHNILIKSQYNNPPNIVSNQPLLIVSTKKNIPAEKELRKEFGNIIDFRNTNKGLKFNHDYLFYYDHYSYSQRNYEQFVQIPFQKDQKFYVYYLNLFENEDNYPIKNIHKIPLIDHSITVDIIQLYQTSNTCYKQCRTCDIITHVCDCKFVEYGQICEGEFQEIFLEKKVETLRKINKWQSFGFHLRNDVEYKLLIEGLPVDGYFHHFIKENTLDIQTPNFEQNFHLIQSEVSNQQFNSKHIEQQIKNNPLTDYIQIFSIYTPPWVTRTETISIQLREKTDPPQTYWLQIVFALAWIIVTLFFFICLVKAYDKVRNMNAIANQIQESEFSNDIVVSRVKITTETISKYMPSVMYCEMMQFKEIQDQKECTICLGDFKQDDECRITVCFHIFHTSCLDPWVKQHGQCPMCRHGLTKKILEDQKALYLEFKDSHFVQAILSQQVNPNFQHPLKQMKQFEFLFQNNQLKTAKSNVKSRSVKRPQPAVKSNNSEVRHQRNSIPMEPESHLSSYRSNISNVQQPRTVQHNNNNVQYLERSENNLNQSGSVANQNYQQYINQNSQFSIPNIAFNNLDNNTLQNSATPQEKQSDINQDTFLKSYTQFDDNSQVQLNNQKGRFYENVQNEGNDASQNIDKNSPWIVVTQPNQSIQLQKDLNELEDMNIQDQQQQKDNKIDIIND